ncbi:hypothetical protein AB1K70_15160 [Bremerella sp. JC770]|uniref:hypothetical protein n=1 Tax=Bremerella sp. JC770 TaxID=3232137 RepID=UPI00345B15DF
MLKYLLCLVAILLVGCSNPNGHRAPVSGQVTLDGDPLAEGSILFTPMGEGPSAGGDIKNGHYDLSQALGPAHGKYRVQISAWKPLGKTVHDEASARDDEILISIIPAKYNTKSTLEVEVIQDGENTFDFDLASK